MSESESEYICSVCLENAKHVKNVVQQGMLRCHCCNLNLTIDNYRKYHKKCKQCESIEHLYWQRANSHLWKSGGKYYKYVKKKDREQQEVNIDEAQIESLSSSLQN